MTSEALIAIKLATYTCAPCTLYGLCPQTLGKGRAESEKKNRKGKDEASRRGNKGTGGE